MAWWPCGGKDDTPPPPPPTQWQILYSPGMPAWPEVLGNGFALDFPTAAGSSLHYVVRGQSGGIGGAMEAAINLIIPEGVSFRPVDPGEGPPCKTQFYFQRRGDDLSKNMPHHRWWSSQALPLVSSWNGVMSTPLLPENWSSVFGARGTDVPAEFAAALNDVQAVGMTFGGEFFAGHGIVASGPARIEVPTFNIG